MQLEAWCPAKALANLEAALFCEPPMILEAVSLSLLELLAILTGVRGSCRA